jgi:hypothetical protein
MSARRQIIAALSEDSYGGIATLADVTTAAEQVDALVAEVLAGAAASAAVIHQHCHRNPDVCAGCQVRADIVDVLTSLADVLGEKATAEAATAELLPKADVVAWLVKKSREEKSWDAAVLASKVARGAVRPNNLRTLPADFFEPDRTYAHGAYRFRCEYLATHPTSGRRSAWGWFGKQDAGWRHHAFSERQFQVREWTDITDTTTHNTSTGEPT